MKVVFRKYKDGDVIALFPGITNKNSYMIESYQHIGQHGEVDYNTVISQTELAKEEDYKELLQELQRIGYTDIRVMKKARVKYN